LRTWGTCLTGDTLRTGFTLVTLVTLRTNWANITLRTRRTLVTLWASFTLVTLITLVTLVTLVTLRTGLSVETSGTGGTRRTGWTSRTLRASRTWGTHGTRRTRRTLATIGTRITLVTLVTLRTLASTNAGNFALNETKLVLGYSREAATILRIDVNVDNSGVSGHGVSLRSAVVATNPVTSRDSAREGLLVARDVETNTDDGVGLRAVILLTAHHDTNASANATELEVAAGLVAVGLNVVTHGHNGLEVSGVGELSLTLLEPSLERAVGLSEVANVAVRTLAELEAEGTERSSREGLSLDVTLIVEKVVGSPVSRVVAEEVRSTVDGHSEAPRNLASAEAGPQAGNRDGSIIRRAEDTNDVALSKVLEVRRNADGDNLELRGLGSDVLGRNIIDARVETISEDLNTGDGLALLTMLEHPFGDTNRDIERVVEEHVVRGLGSDERTLGLDECTSNVGRDKVTNALVSASTPLALSLSFSLRVGTRALGEGDRGEERLLSRVVSSWVIRALVSTLDLDVHTSHQGARSGLAENKAFTGEPVTGRHLDR